MPKLTRELIELGRQGELSQLGSAICEEMERNNLTFQQLVFEYNQIGLNYMLANSAYNEFKIDQEMYSFKQRYS